MTPLPARLASAPGWQQIEASRSRLGLGTPPGFGIT